MEIDPVYLIGPTVAIVGLAIEHFHYQSRLEVRVGKMETKIDLFWNALENKLPDMLLKGNPISEDSELYKLLECKKNGNLKDDGKLIALLETEINNKGHTAGEEIAMLLMALSLKAKAIA